MICLCPSDAEGHGEKYTNGIMGFLKSVDPSWHYAGTGPANFPGRKKPVVYYNEDADGDGVPDWVATPDLSYTYWSVLFQPEWFNDPINFKVVGVACDGEYAHYTNQYDNWSITLNDGRAVEALHLLEGISRFLVTNIDNPAAANKAESETGVLWDTARFSYEYGSIEPGEFNHIPGGMNILFMDGHVEFGRYPQPDVSQYWMISHGGLGDTMFWFP